MLSKIISALLFSLIPFSSFGQQQAPETEEKPKLLTIHGELKAHYRWSQDSQFRVKFPFPPELIPRGQTAVFERTVSPGSSFEISVAAVVLDLNVSESVTGKVRVNFVDLYNRNPTSTDQTVNVKEAWMLFGRRTEFLQPAKRNSVYVLFGKAPKFERQPERNLESYGLVSTAFNRFEDIQLQIGSTLGSHVYWRAQVSNGNPLFFRDANALAGDNGNDDLRFPNPELHLNSGFPILYDAEAEELSFHKTEVGGGLGARFQSDSLEKALDLLGFYYKRKLADRVDLRGTFYGGDLDLLNGPELSDGTKVSLPIHGDDKIEYGGNAELHWKNLRVFVQGVHQELAGLKRSGYEVETVLRFSLPPVYATGGKQLFTFIQPVLRISVINNEFGPVPLFVAPSTFWDWRKYDFGVRVGVVQGVDVTAEYSVHDIYSSTPVNEDEFLTTLRLRF